MTASSSIKNNNNNNILSKLVLSREELFLYSVEENRVSCSSCIHRGNLFVFITSAFSLCIP